MDVHFEVLDYITVLNNLLRDRPAFERQLADIESQAERTYDQAESLRSALPRKIVECLIERHKVSNGRLSVIYRYVEKEKDGTQKVSWVPQTIAGIAGLQIIHFATTLSPKVDAERIAKCLNEVRIDSSAGKDNLKRWSETLGTLGRVTSAVECRKRRCETS